MLKEKKIEVDGVEYTVRELTIGAAIPLMPMLQNPDTAAAAQLELVKQCLYQGAEPFGEDVSELSVSVYMKVVEAVMEVNGFNLEGKG